MEQLKKESISLVDTMREQGRFQEAMHEAMKAHYPPITTREWFEDLIETLKDKINGNTKTKETS